MKHRTLIPSAMVVLILLVAVTVPLLAEGGNV